MTPPEDRQERRLAAVRALLLRDVDRIWADLFDPRDPAGSLARIGPLVAARVRAAQADGLTAALAYADAVLARAFGRDALPAVVPEGAVVGVDRYGRDVATMLAGSESTYRSRVASGMTEAAAVQAERTFQSGIAGSAVHDTDRAALTGMADPASGWRHPQVEGWARVAHAGACDFCVMLAGRGYAYTSKETAAKAADGSRYHDRCRCGVAIGPAGTRDATAEQQYKAWADGGARTKWGAGRGASGNRPAAPTGPQLSPADQARLNEANRAANRLMVEAGRLEKQGRTAEAAALRARAREHRAEAQRITDTLGPLSAVREPAAAYGAGGSATRDAPLTTATDPGDGRAPSGKSLRKVLERSGDAGVDNAVENGLKAISLVHGDGELPRLPVEAVRQLPGSRQAEFVWREATGGSPASPSRVTVVATSRIKDLSVVHEIGHFLDLFAMGDPARPLRSRPAAGRLMDAIRGSDDAKLLREVRGPGDPFASDSELFARAYAQYVATRGGNSRLLRQLREAQRIKTPNQWPASQFEPIAEAFDELFAELGWRV